MASGTITWDQYAKHTNNLDCWVLVSGYLYDTTSYLAEHPGGDQILLKYSGLDATQKFDQVNHSEYAKSIRDARRVGKIQSGDMPQGHPERVQQIKQQYSEAKKKREEERKRKIKEQMNKENSDGKKYFSKAEISSHNTPNDCWVVYGNKVYDVTKYHENHPGGSNYLTESAGKDVTKDFDKIGHSSNAKDTRERLFIGYVEGAVEPKKSNNALLAILVALGVVGLYLASRWL